MSIGILTAPARTVQTTAPDRAVSSAALLLILALGAALRLGGLGNAPLWGDEAATAAFASLSWADLFTGLGRLEPNPPAFYALEKLWTAVAGSSELSLRLPAALAGVAGIGAVYTLARAAFGSRAALWAGLLMALNPQHLEHARDARVYTLLLLTVAGAAIAAHRLATLSPAARAWPAAAALALLAAVSIGLHYTGVVASACVFVGAGVTCLCRPAPTRPLLALLAAGVGTLVLAAPSLAAMLAIAADPLNNASWIPCPDSFMAGLFVVSTWTTPYAAIRDMPAAEGLRVMAAGLVVVTFVMAAALLRARRDPITAGFVASIAAAIGLMAGISQVKPILVEQTFLFSLVFFIPLFGALLAALPRAGAPILVVALLLAQIPGFQRVYAATRHNEDWTGLAAAVQEEHAATGWPLIVRSGMDAMTLQRFLPPGSPASAALSITPLIGGRLSDAVTHQVTHAATLPPDAGPEALCAALGHPGGVTLLVWRNALPQWEQHTSATMLEAAGGHLGGSTSHGILILQRWPGVCAAPDAQVGALGTALPRPPPPSAGN